MKELKELLGAKKKIDPTEKEAKLNAIKGMKKMAGDMMSDDMKAMQKVTVAAPDAEGLKMGLEKAEDVVENMPGMENEDEESSDDMEEMLAEVDSPEQIDELMAKLAEKKAALMKG